MTMKIIASIAFIGLVHSTALAGTAECGMVFSAQSSLVKGRMAQSNAAQDGIATRTDAAREAEIRDAARDMKTDIKGGTPTMDFILEAGSQSYPSVYTSGYSTGTYTRFEATGLGPSGILRGTLLLPVSGHTGYADATKWAKTDTFDIRLANGDASQYYSASQKTLLQGIRSRDFVTIQDVAIPLVKGKVMSLLYYRSGSGGPGGYSEGRIIEFVWDGK